MKQVACYLAILKKRKLSLLLCCKIMITTAIERVCNKETDAFGSTILCFSLFKEQLINNQTKKNLISLSSTPQKHQITTVHVLLNGSFWFSRGHGLRLFLNSFALWGEVVGSISILNIYVLYVQQLNESFISCRPLHIIVKLWLFFSVFILG